MIMLEMEKWERVVNETIKHFFDNYKVFDDNNKALENKSLYQYINNICEEGPETEILHFLFTGESEYIQFAGKYNISLYDEFSQELENKLIDEFYSLNQNQFCNDLENFTDYFLSEHTILLKTYIYDILDSFTAEKLKCIIFKQFSPIPGIQSGGTFTACRRFLAFCQMYLAKLISKVNQLACYFSHKWLLMLLVGIYAAITL